MPQVNWRVVVRDAVVISAVSAVVGISVNGVRADGIALISFEPPDIFVPCPEPSGEAPPLSPQELLQSDPGILVIDARSRQDHDRWHVPGSLHIAFDFLDGVSTEDVRRVARSGASRVVVYGDGADPDSGRELARALAGKGIRNVFFITGGAPALKGVTP